jgi:hypothetical protein
MLRVASIKRIIFFDMTPYSYSLHLHGRREKIEEVGASETVAASHKTVILVS